MPWERQLASGWWLSDDPARLDRVRVHGWLAEESYWARGRTWQAFTRALRFSVWLGLYDPAGGQQGFARAITDRATMAHLVDVFIAAGVRGQGWGQALVAGLLAHPELASVPRWTLSTRDGAGFYRRFGFEPEPVAGGLQRMVWRRQEAGDFPAASG
jgi:GNAT superfamily N-acetyltransferase